MTRAERYWIVFLVTIWLTFGVTWATVSQVEVSDDSNFYPRHLVPAVDPLAPAISFHVQPDFKGAELFFDGSSLSLSRSILMRSHRFTAGLSWTVYPTGNYTGRPTCLMADPMRSLTFDRNKTLTVGSVRRGCWCNDTVTVVVTPKPRAKGSGISGIQFWSGRNAKGVTTFTDGRETRFPFTFDMVSFQLVGKWVPWTLFANPDVTGQSTCLVADREGGGVDYFFTNIPHLFIIGSVQQNCVAANSFEFTGANNEEAKQKQEYPSPDGTNPGERRRNGAKGIGSAPGTASQSTTKITTAQIFLSFFFCSSFGLGF